MALEVYCHTSPSGRRYVGYSVHGIARRWSQHCKSASRGSTYLFHSAIRKYGAGAFRSEVLAVCETETEARTVEVECIAAAGSLAPCGYNLTEGGEGMRPSPAVRAKMRAALLGNTRGRGGAGKTVSQATRDKLRARPVTPETRQKIKDSWTRRARPSAETRAKQALAWTPEMRAAAGDRARARAAARKNVTT